MPKTKPNFKTWDEATPKFSSGERSFSTFWKRYGDPRFPLPVCQWWFASHWQNPETGKPHRSRADFAWRELLLVVEAEGTGSEKSRHTTLTGYSKDCKKYNLAAQLGIAVVRYDTLQLDDEAWMADRIADLNQFMMNRALVLRGHVWAKNMYAYANCLDVYDLHGQHLSPYLPNEHYKVF